MLAGSGKSLMLDVPHGHRCAHNGARPRRFRHDRADCLHRPNPARRVHPDDLDTLDAAHGEFELAFVIADGRLEAKAANALVHLVVAVRRAQSSGVAP